MNRCACDFCNSKHSCFLGVILSLICFLKKSFIIDFCLVFHDPRNPPCSPFHCFPSFLPSLPLFPVKVNYYSLSDKVIMNYFHTFRRLDVNFKIFIVAVTHNRFSIGHLYISHYSFLVLVLQVFLTLMLWNINENINTYKSNYLIYFDTLYII